MPSESPLAKSLALLLSPGMRLVWRISQLGRRDEQRVAATERELSALSRKITKLLIKLDDHEVEMAQSQDDECVVCCCARAVMRTFPCGHQVVCRRCFVKTIQVALRQRALPLRCVICREKVLKLKQACPVTGPSDGPHCRVSQSPSSFSVTSGSSSASSVSNVSSSSSGTVGSRSSGKVRFAEPLVCPPPGEEAQLPCQRPLEDALRKKGPPLGCERAEDGDFVPPIRQFQLEFQKNLAVGKAAPASREQQKLRRSTRIRCTEKLVQQLEKDVRERFSARDDSAAEQTGRRKERQAATAGTARSAD